MALISVLVRSLKNIKFLQKHIKQSATPNFRFPCSGFPDNQSRRKSVNTFTGTENSVEGGINCSILADPNVLCSLGALPSDFMNERQGHCDEQSECSSEIPIQACSCSTFSFIEFALMLLPLLFARVEKKSSFSWAADLMLEELEEGTGSSV